MKNLVFPSQHDDQVGRVVVELVPVDVVDLFDVFERSAQYLLHDKTVLMDLLTVDRDQPISVLTNGPFAVTSSACGRVAVSSRSRYVASAHPARTRPALAPFHQTDQARSFDGDGTERVRVAIASPPLVVGAAHSSGLGRSIAPLDITNVHYPIHYGMVA